MRRRACTIGLVLAVCAVVAATAAGVGSAGQTAPARAAQCPYTRNSVPGWQATFGHATTESAANALQAHVGRSGFQHLIVQPSCSGGWEVALRGICPFGIAYDLQQEARKAGINVVLDYKKPIDTNPDLVAVFRHFRTRAAAEDYKPEVEKQFRHVSIIQDGGCDNDWEVAVTGVTSPAQGADFAAEAREAGFTVSIENN